MIVSQATTEHYNWGDGCDGWVLLPGEELMVIQERMPPGASEVRHFHSNARQFFYVLSGELTMEVEGLQDSIPGAHGIEIPPQVRHRAMNIGDEDACFLVISSPSTRADRTNCGES